MMHKAMIKNKNKFADGQKEKCLAFFVCLECLMCTITSVTCT